MGGGVVLIPIIFVALLVLLLKLKDGFFFFAPMHRLIPQHLIIMSRLLLKPLWSNIK